MSYANPKNGVNRRAAPEEPKILALTGGSGVGKTSVLREWESLGAYAIDADEVYHRLLREDDGMLASIRALFPEAFVSGSLNRGTLGRIVFASPRRRGQLERLTHGPVISAVETELEISRLRGYNVAVVDALYPPPPPLRERLAAMIGIIAPLEQRVLRIMSRDSVSRAYAEARIAAQPDDAYYRKICNIILVNNADTDTLIQEATEIYRRTTDS